MKINEYRILPLSIILSLYLLLLWFVSKPFISQFYINNINEKGLLSAIRYNSRNATYQYLLGKIFHYDIKAPDLIRAIGYYKESLRLSPLQGGCWLDLAKAYQTTGQTADAGYAIERAVRLVPKNPAVMWEAGVYYLINGEIEKSLKNFREFILLRPEMQESVYDMLWKLPVDSEYILKSLIPYSYAYYKRYLLYLMSTNRTSESRYLWEKMEAFPMEDELLLKYTDFLISKNIYKDAWNIWKVFTDKKFEGKKEENPSLLWNGSFEYDILNAGFDWKIRETEGVDVFLDEDIHLLGKRSLGVTFDGEHNPHITIASQIVRVIPGAQYLLTGNIKTDSLTTANGLFFSVAGHGCKGLNKKSDAITGTNFWKEINIEFRAPSECSAISIGVTRERSNKLDNKIGGNAWIDGISLTQR
jgi:tetratricopeptide (TPR) repeat protein